MTYVQDIFEDVEELADHMVNLCSDYVSTGSITVVANYDDVEELLNVLLSGYDTKPRMITINDKDAEYAITLDEKFDVYCEPVKNKDGYKSYDSEYVYVHFDCDEEIYTESDGEFIEFGFEYEDCELEHNSDSEDECDNDEDEQVIKSLDDLINKVSIMWKAFFE